MNEIATKPGARRLKPAGFLFLLLAAGCWLLAPFLLPGCTDYGVGGTGELVVPREKLHGFDQLTLTPAPTTQASNSATQPTTYPATAPAEKVELTIEQVRRDALANNLDLHVQLFDPSIAGEALKAERAKFEAVFTTDAGISDSHSPTASTLDSAKGGNSARGHSYFFSPGINIPLITGGNISVQVPFTENETNNQFSTLNPAYTSDVNTSISIPLLRGFGVDPNAQSIRVAYYASQASEAATKLEVIRVLTDAEKTYWLLYAARRELEVRKKEYDLAVAQLDRAKRQVQAGTLPEVEIVRAESGVADTVQAIITAENAVRQQQRDLKRIINRDDLGMQTPTVVIPATIPNAMAYTVDADRLVKLSLNRRMELLQTELQIATDAANIGAARNATLPLVSFQYNYGVNGLGSTFGAAWDQTNDRRFEQHSASVHLDVPIGNEPARARLRSALLQRLQTLATKEQQIAQITQEVYDAVDTLQAAWQSIVAAQERTILNARLLDVEIRSFNQGLRTSTEVLDAQTKLADAQSAEIAAITTYQIAQVDLAFATGTVLGQSRVDWSPMPAPRD